MSVKQHGIFKTVISVYTFYCLGEAMSKAGSLKPPVTGWLGFKLPYSRAGGAPDPTLAGCRTLNHY